jgi:hypothetical protein
MRPPACARVLPASDVLRPVLRTQTDAAPKPGVRAAATFGPALGKSKPNPAEFTRAHAGEPVLPPRASPRPARREGCLARGAGAARVPPAVRAAARACARTRACAAPTLPLDPRLTLPCAHVIRLFPPRSCGAVAAQGAPEAGAAVQGRRAADGAGDHQKLCRRKRG